MTVTNAFKFSQYSDVKVTVFFKRNLGLFGRRIPILGTWNLGTPNESNEEKKRVLN